MVNTGKCQKCEKILQSVTIESITLKEGFQKSWKGAAMSCPYCKTILSVIPDPYALQDSLLDRLKKLLGR